MLLLRLLSRDGLVKYEERGAAVNALYEGEYEPGDKWSISLGGEEYVKLSLDESLIPSIVYAPDGAFEFEIPFDYEREA
jgi:hypothetical protein